MVFSTTNSAETRTYVARHFLHFLLRRPALAVSEVRGVSFAGVVLASPVAGEPAAWRRRGGHFFKFALGCGGWSDRRRRWLMPVMRRAIAATPCYVQCCNHRWRATAPCSRGFGGSAGSGAGANKVLIVEHQRKSLTAADWCPSAASST